MAAYEGLCVGGPLDGQMGGSNYSAGFLLVDRPGNRVWIYRRNENRFFADPEQPLDEGKRFAAGMGTDWGVRAHSEPGPLPAGLEVGL